ncbi:amidohydrolase [Saccharopolyspora antimicrobica]|uniref:Peptidase M20 domain-containing protein 2 n=1 Tax=Saccharopolyspora antimicrobica TaxID=455193 RepID=A0A1I5HD70_9PSEU|nr:M20 family metallopeptidase [Saccharopolyspora antimicrobica]RKT85362.1 amidohydrolase [Saccharopolyspora antimicrobica]SFO46183.1 amidohydrolase [Saccharopolyspora antimicrobica]
MSTAPAPHRDHDRSATARCRASVRRHERELVELSRSIHAEPELAFAEHRSAAKVADLLARHGFEVRTPVAGLDTALVAERGSGELVVAICAEYDALPEVGHACGHNVIAAAAVGAALALADVADELGITVRLIGTPAEETGGGKVLMLQRGVFDDVAMAMMVHPGPEDICRPVSLAITDLEVRYTGREAHAASAPQLGLNAADALTVAQVAIGLLRQHVEPQQMVHGIVTAGGAAPNIVPAHTAAVYNLRAAEARSLERLENRIRACFEAGATATGCTHEVVQISPVYAELDPDSWLSEAYRRAITELGREPLDRGAEQSRVIGSTDMGNVTRALPAIHPMIAIDCGGAVNHQVEFAAACATPTADRAVLDGALAMAWTAVAAAADSAQRERLLAAVRARSSSEEFCTPVGGAHRGPGAGAQQDAGGVA